MCTSGPRRESGDAPFKQVLEQSPLYSELLDIDLRQGDRDTLFRWFLASLLYGARISETIAEHTYRSFIRHRLDTPRSILRAGWDVLVDPVMREGGYVRYDGRKSTQILRDCETLLAEYDGDLGRLHNRASGPSDLEARISAFYGVGPVTTNIFLRELRPFWPKADPPPLPIVEQLARTLEVDIDGYDRKSLAFVRLEAGLLRLRRSKTIGGPASPGG